MGPEAQAKVISLFHFALREGGMLLLGNSETIGNADGRFEVISKSERLYRHIGRSKPAELGFSMSPGDGMRVPARPGQGPAPLRQAALADLCQRLVMEIYAPAAVLINRKYECLYFLGPTDTLSEGGAGLSHARSARHGARRRTDQAQVGDPAGCLRKTRGSSLRAAR